MLEKLPKELKDRFSLIYTKEELEVLKKWFSIEKRKTTFRVNVLLSNKNEVVSALDKAWLSYVVLDFPKNCFVLESGKEKDLWDLDIYKSWKIYIQWISSQIPPYFLDIKAWDTLLDATAAPGWKTSILSSLVWKNGKVIAVESSKIRYEKMLHNLNKLWATNVESIYDDINEYAKKCEIQFDHILLDAPCSAEGTINLNSEKVWTTWSTGNVKKNYKKQIEIFDSILPLLKDWWTFVYSTCTLSPEENEGVVHYILCKYKNLTLEKVEIPLHNIKKWIKNFWKHSYKNEIAENTLRIIPNMQTEWFYIAKFRKTWL